MKRTRKATWFLSGMLCAAILANTVAPAAAALVAKTIQVYTGIEVFVDDVRIDAGETHGNPDAFAYNGTTYVAVAAISKSLGENVIWDGNEKKVYIGKHEGSKINLFDVCPPYQVGNGVYYPETITMSGERYSDALYLRGTYDYDDDAYLFFNLNSKYDTLEFDIGHIDGEDMNPGVLEIYLDGKLAEEFIVYPDELVQHFSVDLNGALQMKWKLNLLDNASIDGIWGETYYGLTNIHVS